MRTHNRAILLRLTEQEFYTVKQASLANSLTVQEYLRDLLRYGILPKTKLVVANQK